MNKEVSIEPIVGLVYRKWLTEYTVFLVKQNLQRHKLFKFWVFDLVPGVRMVPSWA